jgi:hypothetical protein
MSNSWHNTSEDEFRFVDAQVTAIGPRGSVVTALLIQAVWKSACCYFFIPLIHEGPAFRERTEVGHFQIATHSFNGGIKKITIIGEDWAVAGG